MLKYIMQKIKNKHNLKYKKYYRDIYQLEIEKFYIWGLPTHNLETHRFINCENGVVLLSGTFTLQNSLILPTRPHHPLPSHLSSWNISYFLDQGRHCLCHHKTRPLLQLKATVPIFTYHSLCTFTPFSIRYPLLSHSSSLSFLWEFMATISKHQLL